METTALVKADAPGVYRALVLPVCCRVMLRKLDHIGVEIVRLDNATASELAPDMWPMLIADSTEVDR